MNFYFDIAFLNRITHIDISNDVTDCFNRFLRSLKDVNIIFFESDELSKQMLEDNPLYDLLSDNSNLKWVSKSELFQIVDDQNSTGFKFFFIKDDDSLSYICDDYGYFLATEVTLSDVIRIIDNTRDDTEKYISKKSGPNKFNSWSALSEFSFPINTVIISDRYVYDNPEDVDINIHELLRNIGLKPLNKRNVDIIVISEKYFAENKPGDSNGNFKDAFDVFVTFLNNLIGVNKYNLTLIKVDKSSINIKPKDIHFRILITNVVRLKCGHSFSFFKKDKQNNVIPKYGEFFNIDFFHWSKTRKVMEEPLEVLSSAFNRVQNRPAIGRDLPIDRVKIEGHKSCRLFNRGV